MKSAAKVLTWPFDGLLVPDKPKSPPAVKMDDPTAIPESGGDPLDTLRRKKRRSGQASTIQAGSLVPENIGYKNLLG